MVIDFTFSLFRKEVDQNQKFVLTVNMFFPNP